jgi:outer membrane protein assembly factor BamB
VAIGAAAVVVAAGLTVAVVASSSACGVGGSTDAALRTETRVDWAWEYLSRDVDPQVLGGLAAVGLPGRVAWGLWSGAADVDGNRLAEVTSAVVAGDTLLTLQETDDGAELVAAYALDAGTLRWQTALPRARTTTQLRAGAAITVQTAAEVAGLDPATGRVEWCARTTGTVAVADLPGATVVSEQDGADSRLRVFDAVSGSERWAVEYEAHSAQVPPVVTESTVSAFVFDREASGSGTRTWDVERGRTLWSTTVEHPEPAAAGGDLVYVRADSGLQAVDARTGAVRWTSPELEEALDIVGTVLPGSPTLVLEGSSTVEGPATRGGLTAVDPATGAVRWRLSSADLGGDGRGRVRSVVERGSELLVHADPGLLRVDRATGRVLGRVEEDPVSAVDGDTAVAAGSGRTVVVRLDRAGP